LAVVPALVFTDEELEVLVWVVDVADLVDVVDEVAEITVIFGLDNVI
jgi:hypothetical protein